jgi:CBS domain-containing protein
VGPTFYFFSDFARRKTVDSQGRPVGRVQDIVADTKEPYPRILRLVIRKRFERPKAYPWQCVQGIDSRGRFILSSVKGDENGLAKKNGELLLKDDVLDKQIVDVSGAKVVRVNDIHFLYNQRSLHVVHVDVGFRGLLRRLNWLSAADAVTGWLFSYTMKDKFISWRHVQTLAGDFLVKPLKLNLEVGKLSKLSPYDLADILEELDSKVGTALLSSLDVEKIADVIENLDDEKLQAQLLESFGRDKASDVLEEMAPDEAADLLGDLSEEKAEQLIAEMGPEKAEELRELLSYPEETAGGLMTTDYLEVPSGTQVGAALKQLCDKASQAETGYYVYIVDPEEKLLGFLTFRELFQASPEKMVDEIITDFRPVVRLEDDAEEVARRFVKYDLLALPVVDAEDRLKGVVTFRATVETVFPKFKEI